MSKFLEESKKRTAAKLDDIDAEIEKLKKQKQSLREDNLEERLKHFKRLHHHDAKDVLDKYDERLRSCIYQGGVRRLRDMVLSRAQLKRLQVLSLPRRCQT